jgi:catechol 2,3-dioxygenase-like lactoylglutathione lyase family enzyme
MAATQDQVLTTRGLRLDSLSHFTLPIRDLDRSEFFYTEVLGADFIHRSDPDRVAKGLAHSLQVHVRWETVDISLFQQKGGEPTIEQAHPHHAFTIPGSMIDGWQDHFASWGIPSLIVCRQHGRKAEIKPGDRCPVELYFLDPDGNPLELDASDYPFSDRVIWAPYDHWDVLYHGDRWWAQHKDRFVAHTAARH